ncbi:hypothetical protein [Streptomyces sp. NPDC002205]|uniref:hypothetical protein n=1 Tax=Streptomyces sp. NPDC002205 TaxID=3154411 RepID=UPI0033230265
MLDIAAVSQREAWAIAELYDTGGSVPRMQMLRFDGSRWQKYDLSSDRRAVLGSGTLGTPALYAGAGSAWLFARVHHGPGTYSTPIAARFDGTHWLAVALPKESDMAGVAVLGPSDIWALGNPKQQTAWHWDGRGWTAIRLPLEARAPYVTGITGKVTEVDRNQAFRLAEIAPVPGTDEAWGVGKVELGAFGDANFSRAVIVRYRP